MKLGIVGLTALAVVALPISANADQLDDIISSGTLRCAVTLDFPPMGFRDAKGDPAGFDVDTCKDLAKALGVKPEVIDVPFPDRIPAIVTNRADVAVASTSDTLERAKTIGLSIPYFSFTFAIVTRADSAVKGYDDLAGLKVGAVSGVFEAVKLEADIKAWNKGGSFRAYQNQNDVFLALQQGQIDATVVTNTVAASTVKDGKFGAMKVPADAPWAPDFVSIAALREEYGVLRYLDLFVHQQVRTGRYEELFKQWIGKDVTPPRLTLDKVYY
ncbi:transporter substrate-binding domain-containing protein (plasmid) [Agrobacterium leguminum]|nr:MULTISPECIES: transporter substrate-binding domain-containing protein [Agrobacterium]WFS70127.1 transporter substrate-binding domain-containing protein [Agrobacterium leguminum]